MNIEVKRCWGSGSTGAWHKAECRWCGREFTKDKFMGETIYRRIPTHNRPEAKKK
jgi:hypothetical protein